MIGQDTGAARIAFVETRLSPRDGSLYALRLASGLAARKYKTAIFCGANFLEIDTRALGLEVFAADQRVDGPPPDPLWLREKLDQWRPNLVHLCATDAPARLARAARSRGKPVVATAHEMLRAAPRGLHGGRPLVSFIAPTQQIRQNLVNVGRASKDSVCCIPYGIPEVEGRGPAAELRAPLIAVVGEALERDYEAIFEAAAILTKTRPGIQFALTSLSADRPAVRKMVRVRDLAGSVIFAGFAGSFFRVLDVADVCVAAERGQTAGLPLIEAMARAVTPVASNGPAHTDLIAHDVNGMLYDPSAPKELAGVLERVLTENTTARRLAEAARETVRGLFPFNDFLDETEKLYGALLNAR